MDVGVDTHDFVYDEIAARSLSPSQLGFFDVKVTF
jgi:hypothetical protein